jgi:hypothetical protein
MGVMAAAISIANSVHLIVVPPQGFGLLRAIFAVTCWRTQYLSIFFFSAAYPSEAS